jgi:hypothetical protein
MTELPGPNRTLQRTGGQGRFSAWWPRQRVAVVLPPPLAGALGGLGFMRVQLERLREAVIHEVVPVLPDCGVGWCGEIEIGS